MTVATTTTDIAVHAIVVPWPDLSAYGLEMVTAIRPEGPPVLLVRAAADVPPEDRQAAVDRYGTRLEALGFCRQEDDGSWTKSSTLVLPSALRCAFGKAIFESRTLLDTVIDLRPAEEPLTPSP